MKKSIFLIAPLTFLMSCTSTSEIFDDAYDEVAKPTKVEVNDESGYADYIKNQEDMYDVQIDSNKYNNKNLSGNPSYYGNNSAHNHLGYQSGQFDYYGTAPMNNGAFQNGYYSNMNGFQNGFCQYQCMTWRSQRNCWHVAPYNNGMYGQSWNQYGSIGWGSPYDPYNPYQNCYGNSYYGSGYGYNNYYNNNGFNGYYGNTGGWYNNNYYWSGYYPNGYYNSYNGYWGNPYYSGYNYGWGAGNGWGNNNNWSNNNNDVQSNGNHHYGHRNGTNTGSNSQNNTNYEHTVKSHAAAATPFPAYSSGQNLAQQSNSPKPKPTTGTAFGGTNGTTDKTTVPPSRTIGTTTNNSQQFVSNNPANQANQTNTTVSRGGQPATNQFTPANLTTSNNVSSRNGGSNNTYVGTTSRNGSNSSTANSGNTYANPNKYRTRYNPSSSSSNSGSNYNSGNYNNTSRRDNSSGTRNNTPRNYNSNSNSNRSNNSYNGSRSSSSSSSSSSSRSNSSGSSSSSSRRR